jgi:hypothetical protein
MLTTTHKKPEWFFYPAWIILTSLGVPIAFVLDLIILRFLTSFIGDYVYVNGVRHITEDYFAIYCFVPIVGLLTGALQFGLLRRYLPRMGWWAVGTVGGWLTGILLIVVVNRLRLTGPAINLDLAFLLIGLSIGVGQWLVLRRGLPRAGWWIAANLLGWGLLALTITGNSIGQFGLLILGFIPACITAAAFALLVNQVGPMLQS